MTRAWSPTTASEEGPFSLVQSQLDSDPVCLHHQPSLHQSQRPQTPVKIYSNCDAVELKINGVSQEGSILLTIFSCGRTCS